MYYIYMIILLLLLLFLLLLLLLFEDYSTGFIIYKYLSNDFENLLSIKELIVFSRLENILLLNSIELSN